MTCARQIIAVLLACLCVPVIAIADDTKKINIDSLSTPRVDIFDNGEGMPDLTLLSVSATDDGHVWAGTMRGLARFNGMRFVPVELPSEYGAPSVVAAVLAINKNQVWVAPTNQGVFLWNGQQWRQFKPGKDFPGKDVRRLRAFNTREGLRIYATTNEGIIAVWDGQQWARVEVNYSLSGKEIFDVLLQSGADKDKDIIWIATYEKGLIRCQADLPCSNVILSNNKKLSEISSLSSSIEKDGSLSIWAGSYGGGVARLNKNVWQQFTATAGHLSNDYVHDVLSVKTSDTDFELWVATRNGFSLFKNGNWQKFDNKNQLLSSRIRGLSASRNFQGRTQLWAATDNGAARLHLDSDWRTVRRLSKDGNGVWSVLFETTSDGSERLWLGSDDDGLWRYYQNQWTRFGVEQGLNSNKVRSIKRLTNGALWLGLWEGYLVEQLGDRFHTLETPWIKSEQQAITDFLEDGNGGVWVGLRRQGVAYYSENRWKWFDSKTSDAPEFVLGLSKTGAAHDPVIWATSRTDGLCRYYQKRWHCFTSSNSELPDNRLLTVNAYKDAENNPILWIGTTTQGLIRMDVSDINRPRLVQSPKFPKPPHPYVYGGVQNSQGDVVICTDYGVAFWKKINSQNYHSINYYREDGLPHDECNSGALSIDRYDRAWIGTIGGAAVFNPESFSQASAALSLERLQINRVNQNLQASKLHYTTDGTNANIDIEVALFTGVRESESSYRTHMVGLESSPGPWTQSNVRSYTNLPAGHYVLKIEAKDFAGRHAKPIQIELSIPTPWWQSWWAKIFIGLSVVCTLVFFIRLRERQLRMREKQLITLVDQRTGQLERRGKELHRMNEVLLKLSYRDTLTGIANRRKLLEILDSTWQDSQIRSSCLAFILLDADDFKAINDNYGHIRGDECLQLIAHQLGLSLGEVGCTLGRYGGEEFGIVLPDCTLEQAAEIAAKCRIDIEQQQWLHAYSTYGIVTLSLGVACIYPKVGETSDSLISKADAALYLAKQKGKNRVELAEQVIQSNAAS